MMRNPPGRAVSDSGKPDGERPKFAPEKRPDPPELDEKPLNPDPLGEFVSYLRTRQEAVPVPPPVAAETPKPDPKSGSPAPPIPPLQSAPHHSNLDDFAAKSIRRIVLGTRWFLTAAIAGITLEALVKIVEQFDGFAFIALMLHGISIFVFVCDLTIYFLYVVIEFLLTADTLLKVLGIDVVATIKRWRGR